MSEGSNSEEASATKSALQDNIEVKGKNAYYFAHANTPTGPKWDGKPEPRLLAKHSSVGTDDNLNEAASAMKISSFDFAKSNITKYAFLDDGAKIKIYVDLKGVGDVCSKDDISLDWKERSFSLVVKNYEEKENSEDSEDEKKSEVKCLSFGKLHGPVEKASMKIKTDKIIVILTKLVEEGVDPEEWPAIGCKGDADNEVV